MALPPPKAAAAAAARPWRRRRRRAGSACERGRCGWPRGSPRGRRRGRGPRRRRTPRAALRKGVFRGVPALVCEKASPFGAVSSQRPHEVVVGALVGPPRRPPRSQRRRARRRARAVPRSPAARRGARGRLPLARGSRAHCCARGLRRRGRRPCAPRGRRRARPRWPRAPGRSRSPRRCGRRRRRGPALAQEVREHERGVVGARAEPQLATAPAVRLVALLDAQEAPAHLEMPFQQPQRSSNCCCT